LAAGRAAGFFFAGAFEAVEGLLRAVAGFFAAGLAG
jgi:hypothetical protein